MATERSQALAEISNLRAVDPYLAAGNVMEISPAGGPTVPSYQIPSRRQLMGNFNLSQSLRAAYSKRVAARAITDSMSRHQGNCPPGCCECGTKQTPYTEPNQTPTGLGQPPVPQKPFQQVSDPCSPTREALARQGLTPEMLRDCLRPQTSRKRSRKKKMTSRQYMIKRAKYYTPKSPKKVGASSAKRKRVVRAGPGKYPVTMVGKYRRLGNGSCWDPRTRKFVKRVNCA